MSCLAWFRSFCNLLFLSLSFFFSISSSSFPDSPLPPCFSNWSCSSWISLSSSSILLPSLLVSCSSWDNLVWRKLFSSFRLLIFSSRSSFSSLSIEYSLVPFCISRSSCATFSDNSLILFSFSLWRSREGLLSIVTLVLLFKSRSKSAFSLANFCSCASKSLTSVCTSLNSDSSLSLSSNRTLFSLHWSS